MDNLRKLTMGNDFWKHLEGSNKEFINDESFRMTVWSAISNGKGVLIIIF